MNMPCATKTEQNADLFSDLATLQQENRDTVWEEAETIDEVKYVCLSDEIIELYMELSRLHRTLSAVQSRMEDGEDDPTFADEYDL